MRLLQELRLWYEELLSPAHCAHCFLLLAERQPLCTACKAAIRPLATVEVPLTPRETLLVAAYGAYEPPLRAFILAKHKQGIVAAQQLGQLLAEAHAELIQQYDILVPVPLHWRRYTQRGYNQAEVIAQEIGKRHKLPVLSLVQRQVHTPFQTAMSAEGRWQNVADAFVWNSRYAVDEFKEKRILIIDDLMTTGATLRAVGKVLLQVKAGALYCLVVARV